MGEDGDLALPPALSARYRAQRLLGRGGFGRVVLAQDRELARPVAVKILEIGDDRDPSRLRFLREAKLTATLEHPCIVRVYDFGAEGPGCWIVYEYIDGQDLVERAERGKIDARSLVDWGTQISKALAHAHRHGVIHRDVKPGNILLRRTGEAVLGDFGIARSESRDTLRTAAGLVLGTPAVMAPELFRGREPGPASDQFALAASLVLVWTGTPVYGTAELAGIHARLAEGFRPPALGTLPPGPARALARALAPEPDRRFPDMDSFAAALEDRSGRAETPPAGNDPGDSQDAPRSLLLPLPLAVTVASRSGPPPGRALPVGWIAVLAIGMLIAWLGVLRDRDPGTPGRLALADDRHPEGQIEVRPIRRPLPAGLDELRFEHGADESPQGGSLPLSSRTCPDAELSARLDGTLLERVRSQALALGIPLEGPRPGPRREAHAAVAALLDFLVHLVGRDLARQWEKIEAGGESEKNAIAFGTVELLQGPMSLDLDLRFLIRRILEHDGEWLRRGREPEVRAWAGALAHGASPELLQETLAWLGSDEARTMRVPPAWRTLARARILSGKMATQTFGCQVLRQEIEEAAGELGERLADDAGPVLVEAGLALVRALELAGPCPEARSLDPSAQRAIAAATQRAPILGESRPEPQIRIPGVETRPPANPTADGAALSASLRALLLRERMALGDPVADRLAAALRGHLSTDAESAEAMERYSGARGDLAFSRSSDPVTLAAAWSRYLPALYGLMAAVSRERAGSRELDPEFVIRLEDAADHCHTVLTTLRNGPAWPQVREETRKALWLLDPCMPATPSEVLTVLQVIGRAVAHPLESWLDARTHLRIDALDPGRANLGPGDTPGLPPLDPALAMDCKDHLASVSWHLDLERQLARKLEGAIPGFVADHVGFPRARCRRMAHAVLATARCGEATPSWLLEQIRADLAWLADPSGFSDQSGPSEFLAWTQGLPPPASVGSAVYAEQRDRLAAAFRASGVGK